MPPKWVDNQRLSAGVDNGHFIPMFCEQGEASVTPQAANCESRACRFDRSLPLLSGWFRNLGCGASVADVIEALTEEDAQIDHFFL